MNGIIKIENLSFGYTPEETILKALSFEVMQGEFVGIAGPNGAGKTTLLNLLCGLLTPKAGSIEIDAAPVESYSVRDLAQKVAVVRQEFVPVFDFTVREMVSMARTPYLGTFGFESKADREFVNDALEITDTARFASRPLAQLSGGERQRVFIARALAQNTDVLLLDEPTNFLDLKYQVGIYDLLKTAQLEKGKTIVAITHDINLTIQYADHVLLLGGNSGYQYGYAKDVFSLERIEKVFGVRAFAGKVGGEKFFLPLGKFAKDSRQITGKSAGGQQE
ncbi:MAG TPA: ABC transporter ATP-binding protein [Phycisphaerales bacterium]|nr:ABC transporter ATP-binding protein [Phycisphaerales bacterium]